MSRLKFDELVDREFECGVKQGVLYPIDTNGEYNNGVAWNGLTQVQEKPTGAEETALYADDIKYLSLYSNEEFEASIEAYTYPDEWKECDGSRTVTSGVTIGQQTRKKFGMSYRTTLGNYTDGMDHGYKLHLIYGATASPSEKGYETISDSPDAIKFSWEVKTVPVNVKGYKPTSILTIDSTRCDADKLKTLEDILLGRDEDTDNNVTALTPRLPLPDEVISIMGGDAVTTTNP